jgi:Mycothiol maleylpyruvate isomerase N-terminal domain
LFPDPDSDLTREAFRDVALQAVALAESMTDEAWELPGLGSWTVRELFAHLLRGLLTIEQGLEAAADGTHDDEPLGASGPRDYYQAAFGRDDTASLHAGIAERARTTMAELGGDMASAARSLTDRVLPMIDATPDDGRCFTFAGWMRLIAYLPTRVVEVGVHLMDVQRAVGRPAELPLATQRVILGLVAAETERLAAGELLILALTGRDRLPDGFNVLN